ncbi:MAG: tRNA1(Val) (adenine(37)-N6)-methyltransferase [Nitrospiria bacterium]
MINASPLPDQPVQLTGERSFDTHLLKPPLYQPDKGYRFTEDALLLADSIHPQSDESVLEFGGGCGIISLIVAKKNPTVNIIMLEIQKELSECAEKNVRSNQLNGQIQVIHEDANIAWQKFKKKSFHRVITNPPYRIPGSGRLNPDDERAMARHEISLSLKNIIHWSGSLLMPGGKINFIFPSNRYEEAITCLEKHRFELIEIEEVRRARNSIRIFEAELKN